MNDFEKQEEYRMIALQKLFVNLIDSVELRGGGLDDYEEELLQTMLSITSNSVYIDRLVRFGFSLDDGSYNTYIHRAVLNSNIDIETLFYIMKYCNDYIKNPDIM